MQDMKLTDHFSRHLQGMKLQDVKMKDQYAVGSSASRDNLDKIGQCSMPSKIMEKKSKSVSGRVRRLATTSADVRRSVYR